MTQEYRDDGDAGIAGELMKQPWTINEVRQRALSLGKRFEPNQDIADRLADDLATNGVIVLFTKEEVTTAVSMGAVPKEYEDGLINLVDPTNFNDVAVIPVRLIKEAQRQRIINWFVSNNRC